jgi:hypothetical protein
MSAGSHCTTTHLRSRTTRHCLDDSCNPYDEQFIAVRIVACLGLAKKPQSHCPIPLTGFAEPEGPKRIQDQDLDHREGATDLRVGRALAGQRRVGACLFGRHD